MSGYTTGASFSTNTTSPSSHACHSSRSPDTSAGRSRIPTWRWKSAVSKTSTSRSRFDAAAMVVAPWNMRRYRSNRSRSSSRCQAARISSADCGIYTPLARYGCRRVTITSAGANASPSGSPAYSSYTMRARQPGYRSSVTIESGSSDITVTVAFGLTAVVGPQSEPIAVREQLRWGAAAAEILGEHDRHLQVGAGDAAGVQVRAGAHQRPGKVHLVDPVVVGVCGPDRCAADGGDADLQRRVAVGQRRDGVGGLRLAAVDLEVAQDRGLVVAEPAPLAALLGRRGGPARAAAQEPGGDHQLVQPGHTIVVGRPVQGGEDILRGDPAAHRAPRTGWPAPSTRSQSRTWSTTRSAWLASMLVPQPGHDHRSSTVRSRSVISSSVGQVSKQPSSVRSAPVSVPRSISRVTRFMETSGAGLSAVASRPSGAANPSFVRQRGGAELGGW